MANFDSEHPDCGNPRKISVAICTWNRASLLRRTLEQITRLRIPRDVWWELLVVNNNCTDDTDTVLAEFAAKLPLVRVFEPAQGLSAARNAAVRCAHGDYLLWTDDDVLVSSEWLAAYDDAITKSPRATVLGGPILPWYEGQPPEWLRAAIGIDPDIEAIFAVRRGDGWPEYFGAEDMERFPFGANMMIRIDELRKVQFDMKLGRIGRRMLNGEETEIIATILRNGGMGRWVSGALVEHFIPRERQSIEYVRRYARGSGATAVRNGSAGGTARGIGGVPFWLWREALLGEATHWCARLTRDPRWVRALASASSAQGAAAELLSKRWRPR